MECKMPQSYCDLYFNEAISSWDEAIPIGNGLIGCLIWGDGSPLIFSLDRGDLWDTRAAEETLSTDFSYAKLVELVNHREESTVNRIFDDCYQKATPTKIPAGRIELRYGAEADKIESHLSLKDACAAVRLNFGDKCSNIKTFLHAEKKFGYIQISGDAFLPEIDIIPPGFGTDDNNESLEMDSGDRTSLSRLKYPPVVIHCEGNVKWFLQKTCEKLEYSVVLIQRRSGEVLEAVYYVASNHSKEPDWLENARLMLEKAIHMGFEKCYAEHAVWWADFWSKSSIILPDKLFEKNWYLANYFLGSCSRKGLPPMPLQGVWTADNGKLPPWKGDYHNDLNTQMSYCHYLKANHLEEGECFIDFLWELVPQAEEFARSFYDAPGLCLPSVMTIEGKPLGGWPMYSLSMTNQIWLCKCFEDYWKTTGDMNFLKTKAYPYFKETGLCVLRWLEPGIDGKLKLPISSSPEIHDNSIKAWLTPNSNYDLSLIIYLIKTLISMSAVLGNDDIGMWKEKYELLPELAVNENKTLMISPDESLKESHRHFSHAMGVHPLRLLDYNENPEHRDVIDSTIADLEELGMRQWVGFSFAWMAELHAIQGNGEAAAFHLKLLWENLCSINGFHLNGDYMKRGLTAYKYRPFTLESNMCAADALQEMLLQTHGGVIRVFPAIPADWRKQGTAFNSFRGENGIIVSSEIINKELAYIKLTADQKIAVKIVNSFESDRLVVESSCETREIKCSKGDSFELMLEDGNEVMIRKLISSMN